MLESKRASVSLVPLQRGGAVFCALLVLFCLFGVPINAHAAGTAAAVTVSLAAASVVAGALVALGVDPSFSGFADLVSNCVDQLGTGIVNEGRLISLVVDSGKYYLSQAALTAIKNWLVADSEAFGAVSLFFDYTSLPSSSVAGGVKTLITSDSDCYLLISSWLSALPALNSELSRLISHFNISASDFDKFGIAFSDSSRVFIFKYVGDALNIRAIDIENDMLAIEFERDSNIPLKAWAVDIGTNNFYDWTGSSASMMTGVSTVFNPATNVLSRLFYPNIGVVSSAAAPSAAVPTAIDLTADPAFADWLATAISTAIAGSMETYWPVSVPATVAEAAALTQPTAQAGDAVPVVTPSTVPWHYVTDTLDDAASGFDVVAVIFQALPATIRNGIWAVIIASIVFGVFKVVL